MDDGTALKPKLGLAEGDELGLLDGSSDGDALGELLGSLLGPELGRSDGDAEGIPDGKLEGKTLGDPDRLKLGAELTDGVSDGALLG